MPHIFGGELLQVRGFKTIEEAQEIMTLLIRHWNTIAHTLLRGEAYSTLLGTDQSGVAMGHEWVIGFEQGIYLRQDGWKRLAEDKNFNAALLPMVSLAEDAADRESTAEPITAEERAGMLDYLGPSLLVIYRYFREPKKSRSRPHGNKKKPRGEPMR